MLRRKVWPVAIAGGSGFLVFAILWALGVSNALSLGVAVVTFAIVYPVALFNERRHSRTTKSSSGISTERSRIVTATGPAWSTAFWARSNRSMRSPTMC